MFIYLIKIENNIFFFNFEGGFDSNLEKRPILKRYISFLQNECQILHPYYISRETNDIMFRDLNGMQLEKMFSKVKVSTFFFNVTERIKKIEKIWIDFYSIYCLIKNPINRTISEDMPQSEKIRIKFIKNEPVLTFELLKIKTKEWLILYKSIYLEKDITPYMHILTSHFHELMEIHGDLNLFNQEGFEKKNDIIRSNYFSSTNRHLPSFKQQILKKINRLDYINNCDNI